MPSRGTKFKTPGYQAWGDMKQRCKNTNNSMYPRYGGRGITYCARWESFDNFYADMGDKPLGHTLGRIDNDGNYTPDNCRWETVEQQAVNRSDNQHMTLHGETKVISQWAKQAKCSGATLRTRLSRGWPLEQALNTPPFKHGDRRWHVHSYEGRYV